MDTKEKIKPHPLLKGVFQEYIFFWYMYMHCFYLARGSTTYMPSAGFKE